VISEDNPTRQLQIICAALIMGVLTFSAVTVFLVHGNGMDVNVNIIVPAALLVGSLMNIVTIVAVASSVGKRELPSPATEDDLLNLYQTASIIRWAGLEGAAFMNIVAYLLSAQWWSGIVPAVCLLWMAATFPTADKLNDWLRARERDRTF